ncbi:MULTISPECIES: hypothetical protein [Gammaproteobacteria]|uniref:hypothetical protein n=1 Tax=Gammaproteobacteria TaxID=1236 RepID=UPI00242035D1|nr:MULTISPECIES: hypothetical protein [Gammaproteobacteria]|tara:strand:+ start:214 stop:390 length:177 start_codon:yes stop_codon:yes gene_type:complete
MKALNKLFFVLMTTAFLTACVDHSDDDQGTSDNPSEGASIQMQDKDVNPTQDEGNSAN